MIVQNIQYNINNQYSNINTKNILYKRLKTIRYSTSTQKHHPYLAKGKIISRLTPTPCISFIPPAPAPPVFQTFLRASEFYFRIFPYTVDLKQVPFALRKNIGILGYRGSREFEETR